MLLDVLSGLDELKVCVAYEQDGERRTTFPSDSYQLERCRPVFEALPGWKDDLTAARRGQDLPGAARRYVDRIGELVGLPVSLVSVGPDREQTISLRS
jgi:adenylosuccinate synthase